MMADNLSFFLQMTEAIDIRTICRADTDVDGWRPEVVGFYRYWQQIAPPGALPGRQHFDPADIGRFLPLVSLYEVHRSPLRYRSRLSGSRTVQRMNQNITGRWLDEVLSKTQENARFLADLDLTASDSVAIYKKYLSHDRSEMPPHLVESIAVPLARDGVTVDVIANLIFWHAEPGPSGFLGGRI